MDLSFDGKMEAYYQKFIELQEKLRKSEEERLKLEMKFNEMLQITREEEQAHYRKLRSQYKKFLEEDRKRQERNERIIRTLERIEARVNMLTSRTDRFKMLKRQYQSYIQRIARMKPIEKIEHPPKIEEDTPHEQQKTFDIPRHHTDVPDHLSLKTAVGKSNDEKIKILDKYLQSLASQKCKDTLENEEKEPESDLSKLKYLDNISKKIEDGFNSNQANSIAEDIMNSIYSRHYKKDLLKDETKKANKFTTSNYLNDDTPLMQKSSDFSDSYNISSALENLDNNAAISKNFSFDEFCTNRSISKYEDKVGVIRNDSELDYLNKNNYTLKDSIQKGLIRYDKEAGNKEVDERARKQTLEKTKYTLSKNEDYHVEVDSLVKSKTDSLLKNEKGESKNFNRNVSVNCKQNQNQIDPVLKSMDKSNPDPLFKDKDYRTKNMKVNQSQIDLKDKDCQSKDFTTKDSQYLKTDQRVKFEKLKDDMAYSPSKTEIDIIESEKQLVDNYPVSRGDGDTLSNDTYDRCIEEDEEVADIQREFDNSKYEHYDTEFADNEINNRGEQLEEQLLDNNELRKSLNHELNNTESIKPENYSDSVIHNEPQEIETSIPDEQFNENKFNHSKEENVQDNLEYEKKIDVQTNERIQDEYMQHVINEEQSQNVNNKVPIQYEVPIQYDEYGNQIMYDENGQVVQPQYDEPAQQYNQSEPYNETEQEHYDENRLDVQYDENGQPIHSYDQQYDVNGQPILYNQQYDASGQPVEQLYDENAQQFQQYDKNGQIINSYDQNSHENGDLVPQYDESAQLIQQYDDSGQPVHLYDQSDQPIDYAENSQPIQEYGENEQPNEQYNQNRQSVQEYEQPFQQYENEQPAEQYNQGEQLVQEYDQSFQQYDPNDQSIQQYYEDGQSIQQYDENGQPVYHYDENVQPLQQYDENGQLIQHYDENSLQQYNENDQPAKEYDEKSQPTQQHGENLQLSQDVSILETDDKKFPENTNMNQKHDPNNENLEEEKSQTDSSKSTVKEDTSSMFEKTSEEPVKQKNVLDMLDTDTESVKQSTSKISNDSDFDFSNG